jgi:uncharacterized protein YjbI with pentapeptide repeats
MTPTAIFGRTAFLAAALALSLTATSEAKAACSDPAAPEVDWSGCDKSNANLWNANLSGANLTDANLSYANLTDADLTYADLYGAMWPDGRVCAEGSMGACN